MERYAVALHNAIVRRLTRDGESHHMYPDHWSETKTIELEAEDAATARALAEKTYPRARGFVIEAVSPRH